MQQKPPDRNEPAERMGNEGFIVGNRIPQEYFISKGCGESDISIHAGSYHLALKATGIEMANIITYSSILPAIAQEIEKPAVLKHGAVMETIMAVANGRQGERLTAGIIFAWLYDRQTREKFGGLVCEQNGNYPSEEIEKKLTLSLRELYLNGFESGYELRDGKTIIESFVPQKQFGTALVSLCFTNYFIPLISRVSA